MSDFNILFLTISHDLQKGTTLVMSKYALITGASRGIGREIAIALARAEYNLILTCHSQSQLLQQLVSELLSIYPDMVIKTYCGDVGDEKVCENIFKALENENIHIDVLINNAGVSHVGLLQDMSCEQWNRTVNTNLSSIFYMCRLAIPHMLSNHAGKIINISSVWGNIGASCEVAYSATKGGVNSFTKALAKELAPSNIQVNAVAFGAIDTDMNNHLSDEDKVALCEEIPTGRIGTAAEAGDMVLSILNAPDYLTGQVITMDGGWC